MLCLLSSQQLHLTEILNFNAKEKGKNTFEYDGSPPLSRFLQFLLRDSESSGKSNICSLMI